MKRNLLLTVLSALFISFLPLSANAQGIVINKTNGQKVYYKASEVESVGVYSKGEEPGPEPGESVTYTVNGVDFEMIVVEGGTFMMGSAEGGDPDERPVHEVTLDSYSIGKTEVTQELWQAVMGNNPSFYVGDQLPVDQVSWADCQVFIEKLNELTGKNFRLPTEAEWEFAARGGNLSQGYAHSGSNVIGDVAWYADNSSETTHVVGTKQPNELGIHDMSGNVWEWCQDFYGEYTAMSQANPTGAPAGIYRVLRGGSFGSSDVSCRTTYRNNDVPEFTYYALGLRLAF